MCVDNELAERVRELCSIQQSEKERLIDKYIMKEIKSKQVVEYQLDEIALRDTSCIYVQIEDQYYHVLVLDENKLYYFYSTQYKFRACSIDGNLQIGDNYKECYWWLRNFGD